jgi:hypothetical protein
MSWSKENQLKYPESWKKTKEKIRKSLEGQPISKRHKKDCKCAFCPGRTIWQDSNVRKKHKASMQRVGKEGKLDHWKGKKLSESHKLAIKRGLATPEAKRKMYEARKGKIPANLKIAQAASPFQKGKRNLNWNPNKQDEYGYEFTYHLKLKILERDSNKCQHCYNGTERSLDIHHIDGDKLNNSFSNLVALCRSCHLKEHRVMLKQLVIT